MANCALCFINYIVTIMKTKRDYYHCFKGVVFLVCAVLYCIFIVPICHHSVYSLWCGIVWLVCWVVGAIMNRDNIGGVIIAFCGIVALGICTLYEIHNDKAMVLKGPSIITKYHITKVSWNKSLGYYALGYFYIGRRKYQEDFTHKFDYVYLMRPRREPKGKWSYIMYKLDCEMPILCYAEDPTEEDISKIQDFAFVENDTGYSYHTYALKNPNLVYHYVGLNLVYKASCQWYYPPDSIVLLHYTDQNDNNKVLKYQLKHNEIFSDTLLVYRNFSDNDTADSTAYVCVSELNTPENYAKISDYGYIFHYNIYSKEEIETQCPSIKELVTKKENKKTD